MVDTPENGAPAATPGTVGALPPAIRWLAGSAGLTGILVLIGYVSQTAYYSFLGLTAPAVTVTSCITEAGVMLVDLITILFLWINTHVLANVLVLLCAVAILSARWLKWVTRIPSLPPSAAAVLLVLVSLVKIIGFDLPVIAMNDLLHKDLVTFSSVFPEAGRIERPRKDGWFTSYLRTHLSPALLISWREKQTWLGVVCSRAPEVAIDCQSIDTEGHTLTPAQAYRQKTEETFLINFALMVVLLVLASIFFSQAPKTGEQFVLLRWVITFLLAINLLALPSVYAKTIRDTTFRNAELIIQIPATGGPTPQTAGVEVMAPGSVKTGARSKRGAKSEPAARPAPQATNQGGQACDTSRATVDCNYFILEEGSDEWTLLERTSLQVWYVPRSEVSLVKVNKLDDALEFYIQKKPAPQAPPPPPAPGP